GPISTATPGIQIGEHLPLLAKQTEKLAIIRSIHHDDSAHGRGMYWNLTGHKPPRAGNIPPMSSDWPSLPAMVSTLRSAPIIMRPAAGVPFDGVSRTLGSEVLNLAEGDFARVASRTKLLAALEAPPAGRAEF